MIFNKDLLNYFSSWKTLIMCGLLDIYFTTIDRWSLSQCPVPLFFSRTSFLAILHWNNKLIKHKEQASKCFLNCILRINLILLNEIQCPAWRILYRHLSIVQPIIVSIIIVNLSILNDQRDGYFLEWRDLKSSLVMIETGINLEEHS